MSNHERPGQLANHWPNIAAPATQLKRLAWGPDGHSIIMPDESGEPRYLYTDGSMDVKSVVDPRTPHALVAGRVAVETVKTLSAEEAEPDLTIGAQSLSGETLVERVA